MIIVMKPETSQKEIEEIKEQMKKLNFQTYESRGETHNLIGLIGDVSNVDPEIIQANRNVEKLMYVDEPYKKANRLFHPEDTVISVDGKKIGGNNFAVIAGPCAVESEEQIINVSDEIKDAGATFLRGGAFKPRTSPYSFQGLREEGLKLLNQAKAKTGLPIVSELMSADLIEKFIEQVDVIQIGARNMQNFDLLKEIGKTNKPVLLKRGLSATVEELLMSAEYIMSEGNENVILCERGIRTFEKYTRNTLDISAVPVIKEYSHLPVIVDPSHAAGTWWLIEPLSKAALAAGADGLMIEVHSDPANAKSDGKQSIKPERFEKLMKDLNEMSSIMGKNIDFNSVTTRDIV